MINYTIYVPIKRYRFLLIHHVTVTMTQLLATNRVLCLGLRNNHRNMIDFFFLIFWIAELCELVRLVLKKCMAYEIYLSQIIFS